MARKIEPRDSDGSAMEELRTRRFMSITEFKKNPMRSFIEAAGETFAVLNFNRPEFYVVPAAAYSVLLDRLEAAEEQKTGAASLALECIQA